MYSFPNASDLRYMCSHYIAFFFLDKHEFLAYSVDTMYVDTSTLKRGNKTYTRHLLRTSFRENGKVKH